LSDVFGAAAPAAACIPPSEARAGRLKTFQREQLIVEYLNRGVSIAEIAARVAVGEKRTRAVIREILARRMPHPPEQFVAIQLNRLNEALLVAFSAMSPTNLKAVDQVVKIVRELDRYGGAFAAEWARPEASRLDAPAEGDAAFARAWLYGQEPAPPDLDRHREPRNGVAIQGNVDRPCAPESPRFARDDVAADNLFGSCDRPENPAQSFEKVESAPGNASAREDGGGERGAYGTLRYVPCLSG